MAQFISTIETHGASTTFNPPTSLEITALCTALETTIVHESPEILKQAIIDLLNQQNPEILYKMGIIHYDGLYGVPKDHAKAMPYYELAAEKNHIVALNSLAGLHADMSDVTGLPEHRNKAITFYTTAANQGSMDAVFNLGCIYAKTDQKKAIALWQQAVESRHSESIICLIDYYWINKKFTLCYPLLCIASNELKDAYSQCLLAKSLLEGLGVNKNKKNEERAIQLLIPLTKIGHTKSIIVTAATNLGQIYVLKQDFENGKKFHTIAAQIEKNGLSTQALKKMNKIENYLENEAKQKQEQQKLHTKLLGERKTDGKKCSHCNEFGYLATLMIGCKCKKTWVCSEACKKIFKPKHAMACRKNIKRQQQRDRKHTRLTNIKMKNTKRQQQKDKQ